MLAGISAAKNINSVTILEKMNMCGKKLLITGKGRCNITSSIEISEFIKNIPGNGRFLYSAFNNFTNEDIIKITIQKQLRQTGGNWECLSSATPAISITTSLKYRGLMSSGLQRFSRRNRSRSVPSPMLSGKR